VIHRLTSLKKFIALVALTCLCSAVNAATLTFSINDGTNLGAGFLQVDPTGLATSGSLVMTSGVDTGTYALFSGGPSPTYSPMNAFIYNNMTYPSATSAPALDWYGLLFVGNGTEINIWGNGPGNPYSFWSYRGGAYNISSTAAAFGLQPVPVPLAAWLFGSALAGLMGFARGRQRVAGVR
jgi:hypothetical protein